MFDGIKNAFSYLYDLIIKMFEWLLDAIVAVFQPIIDIFIGIGYFIYKIGVVLYEIILVLIGVGKVALGLVAGLFATITSFDFDATPVSLPGSVGSAMTNLQPVFSLLQFNKIGFVIMFSIWFFTAFAALRIIQTFSGGSNN
jgi:hypothetical protein